MNNLRNIDFLITLGKRVRELRVRRGITQEQLAYAAEIELSQIYRIETAKINPTITTLKAIANGLEITLSQLIDGL